MPGLRDILDAATRDCAPDDLACVFERDWANEVLVDRNHEIVALVLDMGEVLRPLAGRPDALTEKIDDLLSRLSRLGAGDSNQNEKGETQ